jgi:hypothetical protein
MKLSRFSPPGHLNELTADGLEQWSSDLSKWFDDAARGPTGNHADSPRAQFFNPVRTDIADDAKEASVFWFAFPRTVHVSTPVDHDRWDKADSDRGVQDEYCEWAVERNPPTKGKIERVTFSSEVPEYWDLLAKDNPDRLLALYRELASPDVQIDHLLDRGGNYVRKNQWNSGPEVAPVHMTQRSNKLTAAIELAAAATIVRMEGEELLTSEQRLINCSNYGVNTRNSDPHIGASINELARDHHADVTLADPPGLYINDFTPAGFKTPDGTDARTYWNFTRGEKGRWVRGVYEVPREKGYVVGDITIAGQTIDFGAQLADFVSIKIVGLECRIEQSQVKPFTVCNN